MKVKRLSTEDLKSGALSDSFFFALSFLSAVVMSFFILFMLEQDLVPVVNSVGAFMGVVLLAIGTAYYGLSKKLSTLMLEIREGRK